MRISSLFLASLFFLNLSSISAQPTAPKGYVKDSQGRTLVYRAQSSLWSLPGGALLFGLGGIVTYGALHEEYPRINLSGSFRLGDFFPDLHKVLANICIGIPFDDLTGKPARAVKCALSASVTLTGASILGAWAYNCAKLSTPLITIDKQGLQYEGKDIIYWKDVKSVQVVHHTAFNWNNGTGKLKNEYALEIVDAYDRFLIHEGDIAITVETLDELVKQYFRKYW
jgi:hypothetical protein